MSSSNSNTSQALNNLLIEMGRSLLQYMAESWPWVDLQAQAIEQRFLVIAERQRQDVAELVDLLTEREWPIDFGSFPTAYTDLQYVSLASLIKKVCQGQQTVLDTAERLQSGLKAAGDDKAAELVAEIIVHEQDIRSALSEISQELVAGSETPA